MMSTTSVARSAVVDQPSQSASVLSSLDALWRKYRLLQHALQGMTDETGFVDSDFGPILDFATELGNDFALVLLDARVPRFPGRR